MHPIFTQALAAERIRGWHDEAARDQLAKQARRARHQATPAADELPGRSGRPWPPRRKAAPVATASEQPVAMASEPPVADDSRQPAGVRAA